MAAETYHWFQPDTSLRAAYGGAAILAGGDSGELTPADLCERAICRAISYPAGGTRYLFKRGTASGTTWIRVSDELWPSVSGLLTSAESATVVTTAPSGWVKNSSQVLLQPHPRKTNVILRGDSLSEGLGTTAGNASEIHFGQAINSIAGQTLAWDNIYRNGESAAWTLLSSAIGGSSWNNTNVAEINGYPYSELAAYNQRTRTLALTGAPCVFAYALGTNDLAYDTGLSAADAWARGATRIAALRSEFPSLPIIICTVVARTTGSPLNARIIDYNAALRSGYVAAGANVLCDFAAVTEFNPATPSVTANATYYSTDNIHIKTAGHALLAPTAKTAIEAAAALL